MTDPILFTLGKMISYSSRCFSLKNGQFRMVTDGFRNRNQTENGKKGFAIPTMQAQVTLLREKALAKREKLL